MKILVTGGSKGLGYNIVKNLSKNKNNYIYATYNKTFPIYFKKLENVKLLQVDFSKNDFINRMKVIPSIDVLINNYHSGYIFKHIYQYEATEILNSFKVNTMPVVEISNYFIKSMKKNKKGTIISILSELTKSKPSLGLGVYTAEKFYIKTVAKHWKKELEAFNIKIINISPKMLNTDFNSQIDVRYLDKIKKAGGYSKIDDIIDLICNIIKMPKKYCGQNISI